MCCRLEIKEKDAIRNEGRDGVASFFAWSWWMFYIFSLSLPRLPGEMGNHSIIGLTFSRNSDF